MTYLLTIVVFLLMFSILVAVHEWGHYLFARFFKMGVSEFAIGFGPKVKSLGKKEFELEDGETGTTEFNVRGIPLGGFVKIWGQQPEEDGSEVNVKGGFYSKSPLQRIAVLFAGPLFSILFGILVLTTVLSTIGSERPANRVGSLLVGHPAERAGIKPGDQITSVNGVKVYEAADTRANIKKATGPIVVGVKRGSEQLTFTMERKLSEKEEMVLDEDGLPTGDMERQLIIGVSFASERYKLSFGEAVVTSARMPFDAIQGIIKRITKPKQILEQSTGVVGMVAVTKNIVESEVIKVIELSGLISISLGVMNLFPIGMLDGGQILIALIELFRKGKRLSFQSQMQFLTVGMAVVLFFFIAVTYKDITRLFFTPSDKPVAQQKAPNPKESSQK